MTTRHLILILSVLCASCGHVLFKSVANTLKALDSVWTIVLEPAFIAALSLYGVATLAWIWCLQEIPLTQAYLFMSLGYVFIPIMGWFFFSEVLSLQYILSAGLRITGVLVAVPK
ncbi:MAG: hypothetical protein KBD03_02720 [Gammaproteobacteria bacterium]|nr:hypothetical protein [Gammaproteobacteria bacterium]